MKERALCTVYRCGTVLSFRIRHSKWESYCNGCERRARGLCTTLTCKNPVRRPNSPLSRFCEFCLVVRERLRKRYYSRERLSAAQDVINEQGLSKKPDGKPQRSRRTAADRLYFREYTKVYRRTDAGRASTKRSNRKQYLKRKKALAILRRQNNARVHNSKSVKVY